MTTENETIEQLRAELAAIQAANEVARLKAELAAMKAAHAKELAKAEKAVRTVVIPGNPFGLQEGEVVERHIGGDVSPELDEVTGLRATGEELARLRFRHKLLTEHAAGKRSALGIEWIEIVHDASVLDNCSPVSREPDMVGTIVLWEGRENPSNGYDRKADSRSRLFRVLKMGDGRRVYQRFVRDGWEDLPNGFEAPKRFIPRRPGMTADVEVTLTAARNTVLRYR